VGGVSARAGSERNKVIVAATEVLTAPHMPLGRITQIGPIHTICSLIRGCNSSNNRTCSGSSCSSFHGFTQRVRVVIFVRPFPRHPPVARNTHTHIFYILYIYNTTTTANLYIKMYECVLCCVMLCYEICTSIWRVVVTTNFIIITPSLAPVYYYVSSGWTHQKQCK